MKVRTVQVAARVMLFLSMAIVPSCAQTEGWRATYDFSIGAPPNLSPAQDIGRKIGFDAAGNIYVLVSTLAWLDRFSDSPVEYVIFKYDTDGNKLWHYSGGFNGTWASSPSSFHVDPQGNVYGAFTSYYFSSGTFHNANIFKLNSNGLLAWSESWNNAAYNREDLALALNVDAGGNVYFIIESHLFNPPYNPSHPVIQKYDPDGNKLWEITGEDFSASDIDTDNNGDLFVLQGGTVRKYSSGAGALLSSSEIEYWWDDNGLETNPTYWASANCIDIEVASDGNFYVAGSAEQRNWYWVGPGQNDWESEEHDNFFTAKFDNDCNLLWRDEYGTYEYEEYPSELVINNDGNILVTGPADYQLATLKYLPDGTRDGTYLYSDDDAQFHISGEYVYTIETPFSGPSELYKYLLSTGVEQWNSPITDLRIHGDFRVSPRGNLYLTGSIPDGEAHSGPSTAYADDMVLIKYNIPDCCDGVDNDRDDYIDYPEDPGCSSADDETEMRCFRIWRWTVCLFDRPMQIIQGLWNLII